MAGKFCYDKIQCTTIKTIWNLSANSIIYNIQIICHTKKVLPLTILTLISADDLHEIPSQLIALQILMNIAMQPSLDSEIELFHYSYKKTILTHLAHMLDHPSFQIRQMAAIVRNYWIVMNN